MNYICIVILFEYFIGKMKWKIKSEIGGIYTKTNNKY